MDQRYINIGTDFYNERYHVDDTDHYINDSNDCTGQNQFIHFEDTNELYETKLKNSYTQDTNSYSTSWDPNIDNVNPFYNQDYHSQQSLIDDQQIMSNRFYNFHIHNRTDFEEEPMDSTKSRKRKPSFQSLKPVSKKSILEDLLELLDEGIYGVKWTIKIDTEGDEQDGILIYDEGLLERTLQEKRNVKNYGLSKHLSKDLRYYGFIYDKELKIFWNEDNKDVATKKSPWQKNDRSLFTQLKRITSESERNLSRLLSLVNNVELAEALKNPEIAGKVCPPPNKYINLHEIYEIVDNIDKNDVNNIMILLSRDFNNRVVENQISKGYVPTVDFDRLLNRMGGSLSNFLENFREFIKGAKEWYHGFIESDEATEYLKHKEEGTFLIRESTRSDCYSLSWVAINDGINPPKIKHMRIIQANSGYKVSTDTEPSRTLPLWIKNHLTYLKYPLPSPKYSNLIVHEHSFKAEDNMTKYLPKGYVLGFPN